MSKTAILVDGSFYLKRAESIWGEKSPEVRAEELHRYALSHITVRRNRSEEDGLRSLYRIFYYDCPPVDRVSVYQPWDGRNASFTAKRGVGRWRRSFIDELGGKRKVALRMGELSYKHARYVPTEDAIKDMVHSKRSFDDLGEGDFVITGVKQTGVDMRIGLDVASLASGHIVDQIVLIAGDSDFIPVAKVARRAGVDFIIDPMGNSIHDELRFQVDAVEDLTITA